MPDLKPWEKAPNHEPIEPVEETQPEPQVETPLYKGHPVKVLAAMKRMMELKQEIAKLAEEELGLRFMVAGHYFPEPKEGTNRVALPDDWAIKLDHKIDRKVDEAVLDVVLKELPEGTKDTVIRTKYELKVKEYKGLLESHKKIFDKALIIKPAGTPTLTIEPPKVKTPKGKKP